MKIKGKKISGPNIEIIAIPRGNNDQIVFKAIAVLDMDDFTKVCPPPQADIVIKKGGERVHDIEAPRFKQELMKYGEKRIEWLVINSLRATEGLEWETVDFNNPDTWGNYKKELKESGFSDMEVMRIINGVVSANSLNEEKVQEALDRFLIGQEAERNGELSSQTSDPLTTLSGELANVSGSGHQK